MSVTSDINPYEFSTPEPVSATVRLGSGSLIVNAEDRPRAAVSVHPYDDSEASRAAAANTSVRFADGTLRVDVPDNGHGWIFRRGGRVRVEVALPLDSQLRANVGSADVHVEGRVRTAVIRSGSGDTYVAEAGDLQVESGSGDVRADRITGTLRAKTGSGDVSATLVTGSVSVDVASGDVEINASHGPVRANSASGDIRIGEARAGQIELHTASGDVQVGVPIGTKVWLDLNTLSGSTKSDLDMIEAVPTGADPGATMSLRVRTASGDIFVHRVIPPPSRVAASDE